MNGCQLNASLPSHHFTHLSQIIISAHCLWTVCLECVSHSNCSVSRLFQAQTVRSALRTSSIPSTHHQTASGSGSCRRVQAHTSILIGASQFPNTSSLFSVNYAASVHSFMHSAQLKLLHPDSPTRCFYFFDLRLLPLILYAVRNSES